MNQMKLIINEIGLDASDKQINEIVERIFIAQYNDNSGLIYGIGHAVYTVSDPRCVILRQQCSELALEKGEKQNF